jgi:hypothetical protein
MRWLRPFDVIRLPWPRRRHSLTEVVDASFHVDTEAICPDCLTWINPWDYVRRNAFDLLEHEVCPPAVVRQGRY